MFYNPMPVAFSHIIPAGLRSHAVVLAYPTPVNIVFINTLLLTGLTGNKCPCQHYEDKIIKELVSQIVSVPFNNEKHIFTHGNVKRMFQ